MSLVNPASYLSVTSKLLGMCKATLLINTTDLLSITPSTAEWSLQKQRSKSASQAHYGLIILIITLKNFL